MITIGTPFSYIEGNEAFLKAKIYISEDSAFAYTDLQKTIKNVHWHTSENYPPKEWESEDSGLWFSVPVEYADSLCIDRADAFVVALIWYAMVTGSDICSEAPVSANILMGINEILIPALQKVSKGFKNRVRLIAEPALTPCENLGAVGTGMSCGVDSLYTLQKYAKQSVIPKYRLTHLAYFNMGAIFHPNRAEERQYTLKDFYDTTDKMSLEKSENAKRVAEIAKMPLIYVQSNMDRDYYRGAYGDTAVYRNCACVLALQKLFSAYYCSSAGWPEFFDLDIRQGSEHYESMLCSVFSTDRLQFILSDYDTRLEKIIALADNPIAQKYLDVCFCFNSCGNCSKCYRTMLTLDVLGKLDAFGNVFDIKSFRQNINEAYFWLLRTKDGNPYDDNVVFAVEIYNYIIDNNLSIPIGAQRLYKKWRLSRRMLCRIVRKIRKTIKKYI